MRACTCAWSAQKTVRPKRRRVDRRFGRVDRTDYFNVLLMRVPDGRKFLELSPWVAIFPGVAIVITVLALHSTAADTRFTGYRARCAL